MTIPKTNFTAGPRWPLFEVARLTAARTLPGETTPQKAQYLVDVSGFDSDQQVLGYFDSKSAADAVVTQYIVTGSQLGFAVADPTEAHAPGNNPQEWRINQLSGDEGQRFMRKAAEIRAKLDAVATDPVAAVAAATKRTFAIVTITQQPLRAQGLTDGDGSVHGMTLAEAKALAAKNSQDGAEVIITPWELAFPEYNDRRADGMNEMERFVANGGDLSAFAVPTRPTDPW